MDKLTEEVVKDDQHLRHLISICEGDIEQYIYSEHLFLYILYISFF